MILEFWTLISCENHYDHEDIYSINISMKRNSDDAEYTFKECVSNGHYAKLQQIHTIFNTQTGESVSNLVREHIRPLKKQVELNSKAKSSASTVTRKKVLINPFAGNIQVAQMPQGLQPVYQAFLGNHPPAPIEAADDFMDEQEHNHVD